MDIDPDVLKQAGYVRTGKLLAKQIDNTLEAVEEIGRLVDVIGDQSKEIVRLTDLLDQWYDDTYDDRELVADTKRELEGE